MSTAKEEKFWETPIGKKMMHGIHEHSKALCSVRTSISLLKLRVENGELGDNEDMKLTIASLQTAADNLKNSIDYIYKSVKENEL